MRIKMDYRVFTVAAGILVGISGPLGAQPPNTGQQPATQSAYPTAANGLPGGSTNEKNGSEGDSMRDAQGRQEDKRFLGQVTQASLLNVAMGKLAQDKSTNAAVKEFGAKMVTDHQRGLAIFKRVADRDGVAIETELDAQHKARLDKLAKLSGTEFDHAYLKDQLKAHQKMVSYYLSESENSSESQANRVAAALLPAVQKHLNEAKDVNKSLTSVASAKN